MAKTPKPSLAETHPELAAQADGWDPNDVSTSSNKRLGWICGTGHQWLATPNARTRSGRKPTGCPVCSGRVTLAGFNDLARMNPELAKQAVDFDPTTVAPFSMKKFLWRCGNAHIWSATAADRSSGYGCPYCAGQKVLVGFNDLSTVEPLVAMEAEGWDPSSVTRSTTQKRTWKCQKGHVYVASVASRSRGTGCSICAGRQVQIGFNDLQTTDPKVASQAFGWDPKTVTRASGKKKQWKCPQGHITTTLIASKTSGKSGCAICSGHETLSGFNDLKTTHPDLAAQAFGWDPTTVTAGSKKVVMWKCGLSHQWNAAIHNRSKENATECPACSGRRVEHGFNDLKTTHPDLAAQAFGWDPTTATKGSHSMRTWKCERQHEWNATVKDRVAGYGCPYCANKKVLVGFNDLATLNPDLAAQAFGWDPTTVTTNSGFRKKWQCDQGHVWSALINSRAVSGCPTCSQTGFDPNQFGFLYFIDHFDLNMFQIGISNFPDKRLDSHKRRGWEVIELRGPMDGHLTQKLETDCLHALEKRGAVLGHKAGIDKFDGYSEAWTKASLNVTSIKQILDWVYEDESK
jgi:hypothetical protein